MVPNIGHFSQYPSVSFSIDRNRSVLVSIDQYQLAEHSIISFWGSCLTAGLGGDPPLGIGGQPLTQPHLLPGGIGNGVTKPAVSNLMDDVDEEELTALQNRSNDEGEARVLHGNDGEGWGQEDNVTSEGRVSPSVLP